MPRFAVNRPDGTVAIDSNYHNLALRQKGRLVISNQPNGNTPHFRSGTLVVPGDQAIIAYRADAPAAMYRGFRSGGNYQYTFAGVKNAPINLDWWLFDLPQYALQFVSGGKMIVRRPTDGAVVFDSRNKYLKVMDFVVGDSRKSYPKLPATVMVNRAWVDSSNTSPIGPGVSQRGSSMLQALGNEIIASNLNTEVFPTDSSALTYYYSGGYAVHLVVDVQDY